MMLHTALSTQYSTMQTHEAAAASISYGRKSSPDLRAAPSARLWTTAGQYCLSYYTCEQRVDWLVFISLLCYHWEMYETQIPWRQSVHYSLHIRYWLHNAKLHALHDPYYTNSVTQSLQCENGNRFSLQSNESRHRYTWTCSYLQTNIILYIVHKMNAQWRDSFRLSTSPTPKITRQMSICYWGLQ